MLKIYTRQFGLGLMWSAVAVVAMRVISLGDGVRFDYRLAAAAVVVLLVMQTNWLVKHRANISQVVGTPDASDLSRSPVREFLAVGVSKELILAHLVGTMSTDLAVEVSENRTGAYQVRRKPGRGRAKAEITLVEDGADIHVQIKGRIPWWVGVDEGRALCLVIEIQDYLEQRLVRVST